MTSIFITGDRTQGPEILMPIALFMLKEQAADPDVQFVTSTQTGVEQWVNVIAASTGVKLDTHVREGDFAALPAACDRIAFFHVAPDESGWYPQLVAAAGEDKVELVIQQSMLEAMLG